MVALGDQMAQHAFLQTRRRLAGTIAFAQSIAGECEADMRVYAPWDDITGLARAGLHADVVVDRKGNGVSYDVDVVLAHGMDYGIWLELAHGGAFAIVGPIADRYAPIYFDGVKKIWGNGHELA